MQSVAFYPSVVVFLRFGDYLEGRENCRTIISIITPSRIPSYYLLPTYKSRPFKQALMFGIAFGVGVLDAA